MTIVRSILVVACVAGAALVGSALAQPDGGGPGGGGGGPGGGPGGGGGVSATFDFEVCNTSQSPQIFISVISLKSKDEFRVQGWWTVRNGGQCTKVGAFARPGIFVFAGDSQGNYWGEAAFQICANLKDAFDYGFNVNSPRVNCGASEQLVPFVKLTVENKFPGLKWTLR